MNKLKKLIVGALAVVGAWCAQADATTYTDCLTFSAKESFGLYLNYGSGKLADMPSVSLECSTDHVNWSKVDATAKTKYAAALDAGIYKIYLRGKGNTTFNNSGKGRNKAYFLTNTVDTVAMEIDCSGNIETLLDYEDVAKGNHPPMADWAFSGFFYYFTRLVSAPDMPATNLTQGCYYQMFMGSGIKKAPALPAKTMQPSCYMQTFWLCRNLTTGPEELPATTLAEACYSSMFLKCSKLTTSVAVLPALEVPNGAYKTMFSGCTSLKTMPAIMATSLGDSSCYQMFMDGSNLVVNTTAPGKEWKIPATTAGTGWNTDMFKNIKAGSTVPVAPALDTTYYIASAPGTDLGGGVKAYDHGNGTYSVNGEGSLTKAGADLIKDKGITNLVIGAGVTGIEEGALAYWQGLKDVKIGESVKNIGENAFFHCTYMTNIVIGANVENVGSNAFNRCRSLESIGFGSLAAAEAAQETYKIVARITMDGETPVVDAVPEVKIDGYAKKLKGKEYLTDSEWQTVTTPLAETPYHFFKYIYEAK